MRSKKEPLNLRQEPLYRDKWHIATYLPETPLWTSDHTEEVQSF